MHHNPRRCPMTDQPTNPSASNPSDLANATNPPSREQRVNEIIAAYLQGAGGGPRADRPRLLPHPPNPPPARGDFSPKRAGFGRPPKPTPYTPGGGSPPATAAPPARPRVRYFGD